MQSYCTNVLSRCFYIVCRLGAGPTAQERETPLPGFRASRVGHPLESWWFVPALPTEENWLSAATVPRTVRSNQGSAGRGGTEWRALCFWLSLAWLLSAWRKFMLSLCHRKSARPAGDRYLRGACRPWRLSPRALGTMRYPRSRPGKPLPPPSLLEPSPRPPARELSRLLAPLALLCPPNARLRLGCLVPQSH